MKYIVSRNEQVTNPCAHSYLASDWYILFWVNDGNEPSPPVCFDFANSLFIVVYSNPFLFGTGEYILIIFVCTTDTLIHDVLIKFI